MTMDEEEKDKKIELVFPDNDLEVDSRFIKKGPGGKVVGLLWRLSKEYKALKIGGRQRID